MPRIVGFDADLQLVDDVHRASYFARGYPYREANCLSGRAAARRKTRELSDPHTCRIRAVWPKNAPSGDAT